MSSPQQGPLPPIYNLSPPHGQITADDHGGYVVIVTWIFMCFMVLSVMARLLTRVIPVRTQGTDDIVIGVGMIIAIIESVTVHLSVNHGMGRHIETLTQADFHLYSKFNYTSQFLFIASLYFAKLSLLLFIMRLTPSKETLRACWVVIGVVTSWAFSIIVALARQCEPPRAWDFSKPAKCVNQSALYYSAGVLDIITDLIIILLPAIIVWNVQITRRQRWTVISIFGVRIVVCICSALRLSSLHPLFSSPDISWNDVTSQNWTQIVQTLSLITACIPCLRPFLSSLESGLLDSSMRTHLNKTYGGGSGNNNGNSPGNSYALHSFASAGRRAPIVSFKKRKTPILDDEELKNKNGPNVRVTALNGSGASSKERGRGGSGSESTHALTRSASGRIEEEDEMGIRQTKDFRIDVERNDIRAGQLRTQAANTGGWNSNSNSNSATRDRDGDPTGGDSGGFRWED